MVRGEAASDELRAELRVAADPGCRQCSGSGMELEPIESPHSLQLGMYGLRVLRALGFSGEPYGQCTIADAKRGLLRARNTDLGHLLEEDEIGYGRPCADGEGAIELRPVRRHLRGLSREDLIRRIDDFGTFVQRAAAAGATTIFWS
jgi:hypothetical protein